MSWHISVRLLLCFFAFPLISVAESFVDWELPESKKKLKPHYESCKDVDISSIDLKSKKNTSTEASFCFNCSKQNISSELKEIKEINELAFKNKLRKRAIGASLFKLSQTKTIRKCLKSDEGFFDKRNNKCKKINRELISSIKEKWPKMRVQLALSSPPIKENRILSDSTTWFDSKPSRYISKFNDLSALTEGEKNKAKKIYVEALANVPLDEFSPDEVKKRLYGGKALNRLFSDGKQLSLNDQHRLKKAKSNLHRKAKDSYFQIMSELPVLGYLETGNPSKKDIGKALKEVEDELNDQLKQLEDPEVYVGSLLAFEPLVEEMLLENKAYCLAAEKARLKVSKDELKGDLWFLGASVLAAVPCFGGSPVMISACVAFGVAIGGKGLHMVSQARDEAFGKALTGSEFETMAEVYEQDKDLFLEKVLLPVGIWGDAAALAKVLRRSMGIRGLGGVFKRGAKKGVIDQDATSIMEGVGKGVDFGAARASHTSLDDVGITKLRHNADTQADVFQVKAKTSDGKEIEFELEIPSDILEEDRLKIKDLLEIGEIDEDEREVFSIFQSIKDVISEMSEGSLQTVGKITFDELQLMANKQYKARAFKKVAQDYRRPDNSKLSSIGAENVHFEEIGPIIDKPIVFSHSEPKTYQGYRVHFKTQKGKKISFKLGIDMETLDESRRESDKLYSFLDMAIDEPNVDHLDIKQRLQIAIGYIPAESFKGLKIIKISGVDDFESMFYRGGVIPREPRIINQSVVDAWRKMTKRASSEMMLSTTRLDKIPMERERNLTSTLAHELGHVLQNRRYSHNIKTTTRDRINEIENRNVPIHLQDYPSPHRKHVPKNWLTAIKEDGTSISKYGDTNLSEDFAEAMRVYIQTDGGTTNPQALKDYANRFAILDELMQKSMRERASLFNKFKRAMERRGVAFVTRAGVLTHVVVEDNIHIIPPEEENTASLREQ